MENIYFISFYLISANASQIKARLYEDWNNYNADPRLKKDQYGVNQQQQVPSTSQNSDDAQFKVPFPR